MPLNKAEWKTIDDKIEAAIKASQPSGWRNWLHVMQKWGVLAVNLTLILSLLTLALTQFNQANTRLAKEAVFEATTEQDLKGIRGDIAGIKTDVAKLNLSLSVSKPIAQFKASLPELRSSIAVAQKQNAKISPTLMNDLQSKLASIGTDAPSYWPVVADFITYRSSSSVSWSVPPNLPNCRDTQASESTMEHNSVMNGIPQKMKIQLRGYHDCRFALDSTLDGNWLNSLISSNAQIFFKRCVIVYDGGPITVNLDLTRQPRVIDSVKDEKGGSAQIIALTGTLTFDDCVLELSVQPSSPEAAKTLAQLLLRQNTSTIKLPIAKPS